MRPGARRPPPFFHWIALGSLGLLAGSVVALLAADVSYLDAAALVELWRSPEIRFALSLSLTTSILTTLLSLLAALPAAFALSRVPFPGRGVADLLMDLLIVVPVLVVGVSILVFFRTGHVLEGSPCLPLSWLGQAIAACGGFFIYQKAGIVLAMFFCSFPFAVRVLKSAFDALDPRTEHVAQTLGCTAWGTFWRVSLPGVRRGLFAAAVLSWARAFGLFGPISIVAGSVRGKTEVLATSIFLEISIGRIEAALAISLLMVAIAALLLGVLRLFAGATVFGGERKT